MIIRNELLEIKEKTSKKFGSKCYFCGAKKSSKGMVFHHRWYIKNDVTYDQFPKGVKGSLEYNKKLSVEIKKNPKRFRYLCVPCHQAFERLLRYGDSKLNKMMKERKATIKIRKEYKAL